MDHTDTPLPVTLELPPEEPPPASIPTPVADAPRSSPPAPLAPHRNVSPFRALLVVIAAFIGLFLVLRTIAVEPFGVPTGSMAPALCGHHRDGICPRCGYTVRVGRPTNGNIDEHFRRVTCPNCDYHPLSLADARDLSGDRLLVDKNIYDLRFPRRWEMVVFRCPNPNEEFGKPYVKRLVGLPGETITIVDGDVYVNGEIARKGLPEVRETLFPVFDMNFAPTGGWHVRWVSESGGDPRLPAGVATKATGAPAIENNAIILDAASTPQSTTAIHYRHWHLDDRKETAVRVWNSYDGPTRRSDLPTARDFYLSCEVEVTTSVGTSGEPCFDCRLSDGADTVTAEFAVGPRNTGRAQLTREGHGGLGVATGIALEPRRRYKLEFAFVDRRVTLALDGRPVMPPADLEIPVKRELVSKPLRLGVRGCRVVLRDLKLYRDIHYTAESNDYHGTRNPAVLGTREYFVLGDNSGNSEDSRKWPTPAVPESSFIGKPFLIHQPLRLGRMSVGGRDREFQMLDWSRLRWLH